ncbi:MAG: 7-carboxy-7-deazaguanine synthase [Syntrophomonadaceae bacterium]|nr:7-carboxy-7-deazaguanine synthase [Bacillota bacterium]
MKIVEIAKTLHGELPLIGSPCLLIRLAGCNLACPYCDTDVDSRMEIAPDELVKIISESNLLNVLITGGEPLLQIEEVQEVLRLVNANPYILGPKGSVIIETNGTIPTSPIRAEPSYPCTFVFDLKHINILGPEKFADSLEVIDYARSNDIVKFVFWDDDSFNFFYEIAKDLDTLAKMVFSPTWSLVREKPEELKAWTDQIISLQDMNSDKRFAFQVQLHKVLGVK